MSESEGLEGSDPDEIDNDIRFAIVPEWILGASANAVKLYAILDRYANNRRKLWPGQALLAEKMACDVRTIRRVIAELKDRGALVQVQRRYNGTTIWQLRRIPPTDRTQMSPPIGHGCPVGGDKNDRLTRTNERETQNQSHQHLSSHAAKSDVSTSLDLVTLSPNGDYSTDLATTSPDGFDTFWQQYPRRNGKRLHKPQAIATWRRMTETDRSAALVGAHHYHAACEEGLQMSAADAFRWLRDREWEEWQTPAVPDAHVEPVRLAGTDRAKPAAAAFLAKHGGVK